MGGAAPRLYVTRGFLTEAGKLLGDPAGDDNCDPALPEDPIQGLRCSMAWQFAWQTAIALAWSSDQMKRELMEDPRRFFLVRTNYPLPEGLDLTIKDSTDDRAGFHPTKDAEGNTIGGTWYLEATQLTMYLPKRPEAKDQAVGLAAYNATARTYPFTGC